MERFKCRYIVEIFLPCHNLILVTYSDCKRYQMIDICLGRHSIVPTGIKSYISGKKCAKLNKSNQNGTSVGKI